MQKSADADALVVTVEDGQSNPLSTLLNWKEGETQYGAWTFVKKGDQVVKAENPFVDLVVYRPAVQ